MEKILLVEDAIEYHAIVKSSLGQGYELSFAESTEAGFSRLSHHKFDLVLLDIGLPDGNGLSFFAELQHSPALMDIPVIFLTGRSDITDKIAAFSLGAEDYIVKPFDPLEFRARVKAKLKSRSKSREYTERINVGNLCIDKGLMKLFLQQEGQSVDLALTPIEFKLFSCLSKGVGGVFSRKQLLLNVWGSSVDAHDRTVDVHICSLRKKLGKCATQIESVPGEGYRLVSL
jgi:DNA-binding response OmpR family regulator